MRSDPHFERFLTTGEYFFAAIGARGGMIPSYEVVFVIEGDGPEFDASRWSDALQTAAAANIGSHLRLVGRLTRSGWANDGAPPVLRVIEETDWDGSSGIGADFITSTRLPLRTGPTVELILVNKSPRGRLVILRAPHAVMDGKGGLFFIAEIFRALRGEAPRGSRVRLENVDRSSFQPLRVPPKSPPTDWLTGAPVGHDLNSVWRRVSFETSGHNVLGRLAELLAAYMHRNSDATALFAVPVDLRRHVRGYKTTGNAVGNLRVPMHKGDDATAFQLRIISMLADRMESHAPRGHWALKLLPQRLMEGLAFRLLSRAQKTNQTAVLTNIGRLDSQSFSGAGFACRSCFLVPLPGVTLFAIVGMGKHFELTITVPERLASNGRLEDLIAYLHSRSAEFLQ